MIEEAGKDIGSDRVWVAFKYKRLPTFCYDCGKLGHDGKHCSTGCESQLQDRQYGAWLRVGSVSKGTNEEISGGGSRSKEMLSGGDTGIREVIRKERRDGGLEANAASYQSRWDSLENVELELGSRKEARDGHVQTKEKLVREQFRIDKEGVINVGQTKKLNNEKLEVTSPLKTKINSDNKENGEVELRPSKGKIGSSKGKCKKIAREIGKAHDISMKAQEFSMGMKRTENTDSLAESDGRVQKRVCEGGGRHKGKNVEEMAVAARQHY
nr:hypothetical protein CFP56_39567 [Quercus suber]